ncbi:MAG: autotransporter domain-containing protein [Elusimicrobiaceae bacterium]
MRNVSTKLAVYGLACGLFTAVSALAQTPDYNEAIDIAVQQGASPAGWVAPAGSLISITGNPVTDAAYGVKYDSGKIIVRTAAKAFRYTSKYAGQADTIFGLPSAAAAWVTTGNDATNFLQNNGVNGSNATKLLERGLGMNDDGSHDIVVEMAVLPDMDTIMRPIKNPDISTYSAASADYGNAASFQQPGTMSSTTYSNFQAYYNSWKIGALDNKTFPWTQMGYTFFWGNGTTQADIQGMTEFILLGQTPVTLYGMYATNSYIYTLNDGTNFSSASGAQYGNGFASFKVDGDCDTIWAGHRFQKNARTATANEIIIDSTGYVSGGSGILVWSLNYEVTNNGVISGDTNLKFAVANSANVAVLFQGDTTYTYGTPLAGINKLTNSGTISSPEIAIKAAGGDTTIINNAGGVLAGGRYSVLTSTGNDTLTLHGGSVTGDIDLGGGTNAFTIDGATTLSFSLARNTASTAHVTNVTSAAISDNTATVAPVITGTDNIRDNDSFLIINAGTLTADPTKILITNDSSRPMITFTPSSAGNQLSLTANRDNAYYTRLSGYSGVGSAVDAIANSSTGDMAALIGSLDASGNPGDAGKLAPAVDNGALASAAQVRNRFNDNIVNHLTDSTQKLLSANPAVWGQVFDSYLHQSPRGTSGGYTADVWGISAGFDRRLGDNIIVGIGTGYASNNLTSRDGTGGGTSKNYQGSLYGTLLGENAYLSGVLMFGYNDYSASRAINFGNISRTAKSDYAGQQYSAYAEAGKTFDKEGLLVTPLASLQYSYLHTGAYTETGAGAADLSVNSQNYGTLQSGLGVRIGCALKYVIPDIHAKWLYNIAQDNMEATANFTDGGPAFTTTGYSQPRSSGQLGTKLIFSLSGALALTLNYDLEIKEDFYSHYGYGNLRFSF